MLMLLNDTNITTHCLCAPVPQQEIQFDVVVVILLMGTVTVVNHETLVVPNLSGLWHLLKWSNI